MKKNFLIKVGVGTIMSLIFIFWILNVKNIFLSGAEDNKQSGEITALKNDFANTRDTLGDGLEQIKETDAELVAASSSLINELIIETNKLASSSGGDLATSTEISNNPSYIATSSFPSIPLASTSTKNVSTCPSYINCMPTVGEARPCQIPAGCEGITQIAY